jgi:hypothetical protein
MASEAAASSGPILPVAKEAAPPAAGSAGGDPEPFAGATDRVEKRGLPHTGFVVSDQEFKRRIVELQQILANPDPKVKAHAKYYHAFDKLELWDFEDMAYGMSDEQRQEKQAKYSEEDDHTEKLEVDKKHQLIEAARAKAMAKKKAKLEAEAAAEYAQKVFENMQWLP